MKILSELREKVLLLRPEGRVDALNSSELENALLPPLERGEKVLLCCSEMIYISSAGLRVLLKAAKTQGGSLVLCGLTEMVSRVLNISGFEKFFTVTPTTDEGLASLAG